MIRLAWLVLVVLASLTGAGAAQDRRMLDDEEAAGFRGVGRLNVYGSRFCTATLISERLVLTAAHCLFSPISGNLVRLHGLKFVAGQRRDQQAAVRGVVRMAVLPGFVFDPRADIANIASDLALIEIDAPVPRAVAQAFPVGGLREDAGLRIVSYSRDRAFAPSIEGPCPVRARMGGVLMLGCPVDSGASGAPVLARTPGGTRVVAVVSAMGRGPRGAGVALIVPAARRLEELKAILAARPRVEPKPPARRD